MTTPYALLSSSRFWEPSKAGSMPVSMTIPADFFPRESALARYPLRQTLADGIAEIATAVAAAKQNGLARCYTFPMLGYHGDIDKEQETRLYHPRRRAADQ
ncbi:MAG: hypothetical protein R3C68_12715 [Myxococcota bacterium]